MEHSMNDSCHEWVKVGKETAFLEAGLRYVWARVLWACHCGAFKITELDD